jgi:hypothetical protein
MGKQRNSNAAAWLSNQKNKPSVDTDPLLLDQSKQDTKLNYKVLSDTLVILDDEKASAYIELPVFKGERDIIQSHVQRLFDEMRKGHFNPLLVILSSCEFQGVVYKINGQHTCWAKFYCEGYAPQVREIRYRVETEEDLRQLYATYDRGMGRSDAHLTMVELANNPHLRDIPSNVIKLAISGLKFWNFSSSGDRRRCSPQDVATLSTEKYLNLFLTVCGFIREHIESSRDAKFARRVSVVAALFETFSKVQGASTEFWTPVINGIGLNTKEDPRYQLRAFLLSVKVHTAVSRRERSVSDEELYNHCIPAFNKWRKGDKVKSIRPTHERVRAV